jgi:hypothetical protein
MVIMSLTYSEKMRVKAVVAWVSLVMWRVMGLLKR